jgi:hypothetical protein
MEVKKATTTSQITQSDQKAEVTKIKSPVQNLITDSFESKNSAAADSNTSSASTEPEKKAGQITGGILIKQMTNARLGGANPGSKSQDSKNSGLQPPFATSNLKSPGVINAATKQQIISASGQSSNEQTSNAVKGAGRFVDGGSLRSQFDAEVSGHNQDANALGGSDRFTGLLDPTARGSQQSGRVGKDSLAYEKSTTETQPDGGHTETTDLLYHDKDGEHESHTEVTYSKDGLVEFYQTDTVHGEDNTVVVKEIETFIQHDKDGNQTNSTTTTTKTTTNPDGSTKVENTTTTTDQNGKQTTNSNTTETPPAGGGAKSYNQENYTGNIPDAVKKTMEYFKQQAAAQKPQTGGETVLTDDSASGGTITGGPVSNLVAQQGIGGLSNPGSRDAVDGGTTGGQGHLGSQSGGNVDFGQDSDRIGYTGITHEDDPGDVQFGSQEPVVKDAVESKNSDDDSKDSNDLTDILNPKRRRSIN